MLSLKLIVVLAWYQGLAPKYDQGKLRLLLPLKLTSGIEVLGGTGKSIGRLMLFFPTERLPFVPVVEERFTLGPSDTSFNNVGLRVVTRSSDRFQDGFLLVQPPGNWSIPLQ